MEPDKEEVQSHFIVDEATAVEPQETTTTPVKKPETASAAAVKAAAKVDEEIPPSVATSEPHKTATTEKPKESSSRKSSFTKIDSSSLKRKIKNPLDKIMKMADNLSMKKVKMPTIPKYPFKKGDIVLNEELKIGKLKESPKADHREITSYVFKHQDSDESASSIDIVELEESPMESRRRNIILTPDEIIELPAKRDASVASTIDTTDITLSESSSTSPRKSTSPGIRGYADIEAYIAHITTDIEHVDRSSHTHEFKLTRQDDIMSLPDDPIFDEFSRAMNKSIRKSLSAQDEKMRQELSKQRVPKLDELGMQSSEEDKLDDTPSNALKPSSHHLLAPISSIDSTSSDEHSKAHLSALAEESESSDKRKSFETEPSVDIEVESLKNDNDSNNNDDAVSDISTTLIEDEMKALEHSTIVAAPAAEEEAAPPSSIDEKLTITVDEPIEMVKPLGETSTTSTETMIKSSGNKEDDSGGNDGEEKKKLELESNQQTDESSAVKEDIIVKSNSAEPAKKISSRWSKIGFVFFSCSKIPSVFCFSFC